MDDVAAAATAGTAPAAAWAALSCRVALCRIMSHCVAPHYVTSCQVTSFMSSHATLRGVTSRFCQVTSRHIMSHILPLQQRIKCHDDVPPSTGQSPIFGLWRRG